MNENATNEKPLIIYLIAGEPSGDFLGAQLMRSLRVQSQRKILFYGVGGKKMEEQGLVSLFPYHELSKFIRVYVISFIVTVAFSKLIGIIFLIFDDINIFIILMAISLNCFLFKMQPILFKEHMFYIKNKIY